jgi:hypothetical protein
VEEKEVSDVAEEDDGELELPAQEGAGSEVGDFDGDNLDDASDAEENPAALQSAQDLAQQSQAY